MKDFELDFEKGEQMIEKYGLHIFQALFVCVFFALGFAASTMARNNAIDAAVNQIREIDSQQLYLTMQNLERTRSDLHKVNVNLKAIEEELKPVDPKDVGEFDIGVNYRHESSGDRMKVLTTAITQFHDYCYIVEDLMTGELRTMGIGPGYGKGWSVEIEPVRGTADKEKDG